jgi:hypothetical protein
MPNATGHRPVNGGYPRTGSGHHHHHDHCPAHCRYCGPDAGAWDVGELVVGLVFAVVAVVSWLVRHPAAAFTLVAAGAVAWVVV